MQDWILACRCCFLTDFYFSGIHALMGAMQLTDPLAEIWTIFTVLVYLYESDFLMGLAAYVFYELLRVCFDRKL